MIDGTMHAKFGRIRTMFAGSLIRVAGPAVVGISLAVSFGGSTALAQDVGTAPAVTTRSASLPIVEFIPATSAHRHAAGVYEAIWAEFGDRIVAALEARTCMPFAEARVFATVDDGVSHSGGPAHPMQLRATYPLGVKRSTLVHELGHRHLWQLEERIEDVDGHQTLYLILDRVWADVWGEDFAQSRVRDESAWRSGYDYAEAWSWVDSLDASEREALWLELLRLNGFDSDCAVFAVISH
jgi:hypothetical protein